MWIFNNIGSTTDTDIKEAFTKADGTTMEETLKATNVSDKIINLTKLSYKESETIVVTNGKKGEIVRTEGGVRQGCPLSPYLLIIVLEPMAI